MVVGCACDGCGWTLLVIVRTSTMSEPLSAGILWHGVITDVEGEGVTERSVCSQSSYFSRSTQLFQRSGRRQLPEGHGSGATCMTWSAVRKIGLALYIWNDPLIDMVRISGSEPLQHLLGSSRWEGGTDASSGCCSCAMIMEFPAFAEVGGEEGGE